MSRVRDHWSIGEVLSLLQDEFPEVTISKIRFLESQGLIDPERTPSGYRKFSDEDYDRLYWILEQQRDHYLPLRVIRDRLEEGQDIDAAPRRSESRIGDEISDDDYDEYEEQGELEFVERDRDGELGSRTNNVTRVLFDGASDLDRGKRASEGSSSFVGALAEREGPLPSAGVEESHPVQRLEENNLTAALTNSGRAAASLQKSVGAVGEAAWLDASSDPEGVFAAIVAPPPNDSSIIRSTSGASNETESIEAGSNDSKDGSTKEATAGDEFTNDTPDPGADNDDEDAMSSDSPKAKPAPRLLGTRSEGPRPVTKTTAEALAPPPRPSLPGSSVALTRDELAEQSGCTPGLVAELEKHGMISPRNVGGTILFDSTALTLARLAVQFGRFGLEPRHLRTFRLSAEREVALLTQSIGPTLKANNPETRRRSFDTLQDLAELSASLRSIIVRDLVADLEPGG